MVRVKRFGRNRENYLNFIKFMPLKIPLTYHSFVIGNSFLPTTWRKRIMLCVIAILGGFTMLTTFACVRFMPVADAITLIFTNPFFTMLFAAVFLGHRLSVLKITSGRCELVL